ncbi:MAG: hypothetical protein U0X73_03700 [Thermoanaerobaculia bacterium]
MRSHGAGRVVAALAAGLVAAPLAADPAVAPPAEPGPRVDRREQILVRSDCFSGLGRREITLFANGTIRLREGPLAELALRLGELGDDQLAAFLRRLAEPDLSEVGRVESAPDGPWVEKCILELALPDRPARHFDYQRYASLPLGLSSLVRIVDELSTHVDPDSRDEHLPLRYEPRPGDILKRTDGQLFEVVAFTSDGKGVELNGRSQPITLYVARGELTRQFIALVSRARRP